jgi:hypothetical protein
MIRLRQLPPTDVFKERLHVKMVKAHWISRKTCPPGFTVRGWAVNLITEQTETVVDHLFEQQYPEGVVPDTVPHLTYAAAMVQYRDRFYREGFLRELQAVVETIPTTRLHIIVFRVLCSARGFHQALWRASAPVGPGGGGNSMGGVLCLISRPC